MTVASKDDTGTPPRGVLIRRYEPADFERVWELHLEGVLFGRKATERERTPEVQAAMRELEADLHAIEETYLGDGSNFWVAETEDGLVAMTALQKVDERTGRLRRMRVTEGWRRKGLARALLERVIDFCRACGYSRLILDTTEHQAAAQALYERRGFVKTGEHRVGPFLVYDYQLELEGPAGQGDSA